MNYRTHRSHFQTEAELQTDVLTQTPAAGGESGAQQPPQTVRRGGAPGNRKLGDYQIQTAPRPFF